MQTPRERETGPKDGECQRAAAALARGDLDGAARAYRKAIRRGTTDPDAYNNLGAILARQGDLDAAILLFERALSLAPHGVDARANLAGALAARGAARYAAGRGDGAAADLRASLALDPRSPRTAADLGAVLVTAGNPGEAARWSREALALAPGFAPAHVNLSAALLQQGDLQGALRHGVEALRLAPERPDYHSAVLMALNYDPGVSPAALAREHLAFDARFGVAAPGSPRRRRDPGRRLRVAYLSPDLRRHSVAFFFEPLLGAHDRASVEITCYADSSASDGVTERLRASAEHWHVVAGTTDQALAERIARDEIDVLVDLCGHTGKNRMALFAGRAAPVQFTYLGYPATTGLAAMDYRVTDALADPVGASEALHSERLVRLDGGFLCYSPPLPASECPAVTPPPSVAGGPVTFGSFNALMKVNDLVLDAWASLLHQVPGARLLLKAGALGDEEVRQRLWSRLEARQVDRTRVELLPAALGLAAHLATYQRLDIALDTFPYNGTTTTCEALWMGVPVIAFAGAAHAGRVGCSILERVGLGELAPATLAHALAAAVRLAGDPDRLVALRRSMRDRMLASPLMDAGRVARQLEAAYHQAF